MKKIPVVLHTILSERYSAARKKAEPDYSSQPGQYNINDPQLPLALPPLEAQGGLQNINPYYIPSFLPSPDNARYIKSARYPSRPPSWTGQPENIFYNLGIEDNIDTKGRLLDPGLRPNIKYSEYPGVFPETGMAPEFLKNIKKPEATPVTPPSVSAETPLGAPVETPTKQTSPFGKDFSKQLINQAIKSSEFGAELAKGIGKFGVGAYIGSYPFETVYKPTYEYSKEYIPEPAARAGAMTAGTLAAIPVVDAAMTGVPEALSTAARTRMASGVIPRALQGIQAGTSATTASSLRALGAPATYLLLGGVIAAPYAIEAETELEKSRADMLRRLDAEAENKNKLRQSLGLKPEKSWWEDFKTNFAKSMILGGDRGIMSAGRQ